MSTTLRDRVVVITGATDGIGKQAAFRLAAQGAHVVVVGRNSAKASAVVREICARAGPGRASFAIADLSLQRDVHELARQLRSQHARIDVLINNAGAIFAERQETSEGLERTFALNHLAYFTLTLLLLPALYASGRAGAPSRIVNVASRAHTRAQLDLHDLQSVRSFRAWRTYNNSKLANILFTSALAQRLEHGHIPGAAQSARVVTHCLHPGVVASQFAATNNGVWGRMMRAAMNVVSITPERGADTIVHLATAPDAAAMSGLYWDKCRVIAPSRAAQDRDLAEGLWGASSNLANVDADDVVRRAMNAN